MNVSETSKVILQPLRDVAKEIVFKTDTAKRDQSKQNRYWFNFPAQWTNQLDKDSIVGIRSMYISRALRKAHFNLYVYFYDETNPSITYCTSAFNMPIYFDSKDTLHLLCERWDKFWVQNKVITYIKDPTTSMFVEPTWGKNFRIRITYDIEDTGCVLRIGRDEYEDQDYYTWTDSTGEQHKAKFWFWMQPLTTDAEALYGSNEYWDDIAERNVRSSELFIKMWSRYHLFLTSSIASEAEDNFLGHTDRVYTPIKYFRLTGDSKSFWIDLYETRNHNCPIQLPLDNRDVLYVEAVVCFNSSAML